MIPVKDIADAQRFSDLCEHDAIAHHNEQLERMATVAQVEKPVVDRATILEGAIVEALEYLSATETNRQITLAVNRLKKALRHGN